MKRPYAALSQPGAGLDKLLGELEREIMAIMWAGGEGSVRAVREQLNAARPPDKQLAYTTVMTVMARLADKGILRRTLVGRAHEYAVVEDRDALLARASRDLALQMVADFGEAAVASFLSVLEDVAPDRLAKLRGQAQRRDQT